VLRTDLRVSLQAFGINTSKYIMNATKLFGPVVTGLALVAVVAAADRPSPQVSVQRYQTPENSPFIEPHEADKDVWAAVHKVFAEHRFNRPSIVIRGEGGVTWFTADRILEGKGEAFDRVFVGITPAAAVQSRMVAYVRGPSDWAIRGRLLGGDLRAEAALVGEEVESALQGRGK
jgi:hypothetical protein